MKSIGQVLGNPLKPMLLLLVVLIAVALLTSGGSAGQSGGMPCAQLTDNAEFNRLVCRFNPMHLLQMPVSELLPAFLRG